MSNYDNCWLVCSWTTCKVFDRLLNHAFTIRIKGWSGFIKYYYLWLSHQSTSYWHPLFLSSTQIITLLSYLRIKTFWKSFVITEKLEASSSFSCISDISFRIIFESINNVLFDGAREESGFLIDKSDLFSEMNGIDVGLVVRAIKNGSWFDLVEFFDKFDDGWFAWATLSNKSNILTLIYFEWKIFNYDCFWNRILKCYVFELYLASYW